eukprot:CAMPEP_0184983596 /NCGR_PEP_ID=MMETSP1098-20130426/12731_1 /TAXON_ID=89044 /ORGANISM="Spumella elongata, Strain CCAP 955/1" /LENGTH=908 /DNA_ID=CAMNT_0027507431 /DNA_START=215 /DNA_END=2941 /DNA_ORIENTATION=-
MDSWSLQQVEMMRQGGNEQIKRFFRKLEIENSPIKTLYTSKGANHYRERLKEKVGKIMSGEIKSESRIIPHASRHRNTRSQSAIADLIHGAKTPQALNGDKRKSSFEQYHVSFGDGPMGMTISKDFGGRALVSRLVSGGPAEKNGVTVGDHITGVAKKRLDDYDEIMHMIPCLTRPIDIQFTRRIEMHPQHQYVYLHQHLPLTPGAHSHIIEPISPGNVSRSMHGSKSMANLSLNLNNLDLSSPGNGNYRSKARIRTPRVENLGNISESHPDDDHEEGHVRSPDTFVRLVSFRTRSKDLESPTKLNFNDVEPQVVHVSSTEFSQTDQVIERGPAAVVLELKPPSEDNTSPALREESSTKSSQQDSPLFLELSESSTPAPPTPNVAGQVESNSSAASARSTESKDTRSHSVDLCKQIDELLEGGVGGRLSLEDTGSQESPRPDVSRHTSRQSMLGLESPETNKLSDQHVLFSGEGLTRKLTLHTLQNGTPIKVFRNEKWKSAILRRVHRDGSFKVTFRDGSTESHVALQRLAMTTDTLRALSDWHACTRAAESFSDAHLDEAFRAASQDGDGARASLAHSLRLEAERAQAEATEAADGFSSPETSSYANRIRLRSSQSQQSVHSFRVEDLQPGVSEDFFPADDADLDRWINSEEDIGIVEGSASDIDRDRASSFDSVLSDGRAAQKLHTNHLSTNSNTFAAPAPLTLHVTYHEAPLGLRLSTNRSNAASASNTTNNSPMPGHTHNSSKNMASTAVAMSPAARPSRQPEITKVVAGGRSDAEGVLVGDVLVQIEEHRIVDYTHAMRILQECTYPITLQFQRSAASFAGENTQSTKSLVDELLGVHKAPLSLSPPQTKRLSFNRLSNVPVLELCATPNDSPHRPVHSARTDTSAADANTAPKTPVPGMLPL